MKEACIVEALRITLCRSRLHWVETISKKSNTAAKTDIM